MVTWPGSERATFMAPESLVSDRTGRAPAPTRKHTMHAALGQVNTITLAQVYFRGLDQPAALQIRKIKVRVPLAPTDF